MICDKVPLDNINNNFLTMFKRAFQLYLISYVYNFRIRDLHKKKKNFPITGGIWAKHEYSHLKGRSNDIL